MVMETPPHAQPPMQEMMLMPRNQIELARKNNPEIVIREADDEDLKNWTLSPQIFHDEVPWQGIRVTDWELNGGLAKVFGPTKRGMRRSIWSRDAVPARN